MHAKETKPHNEPYRGPRASNRTLRKRLVSNHREGEQARVICPVKSGVLAIPGFLTLDGSRCRATVKRVSSCDRVRVAVLVGFVQ